MALSIHASIPDKLAEDVKDFIEPGRYGAFSFFVQKALMFYVAHLREQEAQKKAS